MKRIGVRQYESKEFSVRLEDLRTTSPSITFDLGLTLIEHTEGVTLHAQIKKGDLLCATIEFDDCFSLQSLPEGTSIDIGGFARSQYADTGLEALECGVIASITPDAQLTIKPGSSKEDEGGLIVFELKINRFLTSATRPAKEMRTLLRIKKH